MSINEINRNNSIKYKKFSPKFLTKNEYLLSIYILSLITMLLFDKLETQDQMKCILINEQMYYKILSAVSTILY